MAVCKDLTNNSLPSIGDGFEEEIILPSFMHTKSNEIEKRRCSDRAGLYKPHVKQWVKPVEEIQLKVYPQINNCS